MPPSLPTPGSILSGEQGEYAIVSTLGKGAFGAVLRAKKLTSGDPCAIKVLHGGRYEVTDAMQRRFSNEIKRTLELNHPNIVRAYDHGRFQGSEFLVMEYMEGGTVAERIETAGRNSAEDYSEELALKWCADILAGVLYLHENGGVHRDIKPNNILLSADGQTAKIADLGLALDVEHREHLTNSAEHIGALLYISRNQRRNPSLAGPADDAYAVCCCLYEILSREPMHVFPHDLRTLTAEGIPRYLCDLIMGGLAGLEGVETLDRLRECLEVEEGTKGRVSALARHPRLNECVRLMPALGRHPGLDTRRFAENAPLAKTAELNLGAAHPSVGYLDESTIVVLPEDWDAHGGRLRILRVESGHLREAPDERVSYAGKLAVVSPGRIAIAGRNGLEICRVAASGVTREAHWEAEAFFLDPTTKDKFSAVLDLVSSSHGAQVAVLQYNQFPIVVDIETRQILRLCSIEIPKDFSYPKGTFLGPGRLAVALTDEIVVYDYDSSGDSVFARIPFPREKLSLSSSPDGRTLIVGHVGGIANINLWGGTTGFAFPFYEIGTVMELSVSPDGKNIAALLGFMHSRPLVADLDGVAMAYLPDSGDSDTLRRSVGIAWSPSGLSLSVTDRAGWLTAYSRLPFP